MSSTTSTLDNTTFDEEIQGSSLPLLVDFWAEWCGPCKIVAPILEEIASEHADKLRVAKLNVDDAPQVARRFNVMSIPTMILFQEGKPATRIVGAKSKAALLSDLEPYI